MLREAKEGITYDSAAKKYERQASESEGVKSREARRDDEQCCLKNGESLRGAELSWPGTQGQRAIAVVEAGREFSESRSRTDPRPQRHRTKHSAEWQAAVAVLESLAGKGTILAHVMLHHDFQSSTDGLGRTRSTAAILSDPSKSTKPVELEQRLPLGGPK